MKIKTEVAVNSYFNPPFNANITNYPAVILGKKVQKSQQGGIVQTSVCDKLNHKGMTWVKEDLKKIAVNYPIVKISKNLSRNKRVLNQRIEQILRYALQAISLTLHLPYMTDFWHDKLDLLDSPLIQEIEQFVHLRFEAFERKAGSLRGLVVRGVKVIDSQQVAVQMTFLSYRGREFICQTIQMILWSVRSKAISLTLSLPEATFFNIFDPKYHMSATEEFFFDNSQLRNNEIYYETNRAVAVAKVIGVNPDVTHLSLEKCDWIVFRHLEIFSRFFPRLESINCLGCTALHVQAKDTFPSAKYTEEEIKDFNNCVTIPNSKSLYPIFIKTYLAHEPFHVTFDRFHREAPSKLKELFPKLRFYISPNGNQYTYTQRE